MPECVEIMLKIWCMIIVIIVMLICAPFVWIAGKIEDKFWNWFFK